MTTFLFNTVLTAGSDKMAASDPHGWTLTLVSVMVVFSALIILYFLYTFSGNIFAGKYKRKPKAPKVPKGTDEAAVAAAIAMALEAESGCGEVEAAIATALHLYLGEAVHDIEPGFITIKHSENTNWKFRR